LLQQIGAMPGARRVSSEVRRVPIQIKPQGEIMRVGIFGTIFARAGHEVTFSYSRDDAKLLDADERR
jgi:hypothetical protein